MLGPGLMRTLPGVLRSVGSCRCCCEGEPLALSLSLALLLPPGAGVRLDRDAARVLPRGRPRGGILVGRCCCVGENKNVDRWARYRLRRG